MDPDEWHLVSIFRKLTAPGKFMLLNYADYLEYKNESLTQQAISRLSVTSLPSPTHIPRGNPSTQDFIPLPSLDSSPSPHNTSYHQNELVDQTSSFPSSLSKDRSFSMQSSSGGHHRSSGHDTSSSQQFNSSRKHFSTSSGKGSSFSYQDHGRTVSPTPTPHSEIVYSPPRPTIDQDPQSWSEPKTDADKKRDEEHKQYISQIDKHGKKRVDPLLPLAVERQSARSTKGLEPSPPLLQTPPAPPVFNPNDPRIQSLVFDSNQSSVPTIAKSEEPVARNLAESLFSSDAELEGYGFI